MLPCQELLVGFAVCKVVLRKWKNPVLGSDNGGIVPTFEQSGLIHHVPGPVKTSFARSSSCVVLMPPAQLMTASLAIGVQMLGRLWT